jgi:isopentenyl-diphosphate delta-isomerase
MAEIASRKNDHLDLSIGGDVGFRKTHLFEYVELLHDALPELSLDEVDTRVEIFGKVLRAPIIIAAMTGGNERARAINLDLASIAEECGYGFGVGSQRAMLMNRDVQDSYSIRSVAPSTLLLGNLGGVQAAKLDCRAVADLANAVGADALCVHLNPAMELVQPEGDRDFRGILDTLQRLSAELQVPVVAKETGCGISSGVARRLLARGIKHVDVSGAGGTSWVAVETERLQAQQRDAVVAFRDWGIPTAASVAYCSQAGMETIVATGGIANGIEVAKAIAMGAHAAGLARPVLKAFHAEGRSGALNYLRRVEAELKMAMLLTAARDVRALRNVERRILPPLRDWIA